MDRIEQYAHAGLTFDVSDEGPVDGRAVILLHGFPEDRQCWRSLAAVLVDAGYRTLAPDQRGYSPGARPPGRRAYTLDRVAGDTLALADAVGADRFDLVGHDWGAALGWHLAGHYPERVRSLTALSVPHPRAMIEALVRSTQALHSWYMLYFQLPGLPELAFSRAGERRFAAQLRRSGLDEESARRYAVRTATPGALTGPLNWYRALPFESRDRLGSINTPTLFVWGDRDQFLTRVAAERCGRHVTGPFRALFVVGASHWLPATSSAEVAPALLDHLASVVD
jgi:pimeloyl-ACP methyl ester carboxylesterase